MMGATGLFALYSTPKTLTPSEAVNVTACCACMAATPATTKINKHRMLRVIFILSPRLRWVYGKVWTILRKETTSVIGSDRGNPSGNNGTLSGRVVLN